MKATTWTPVMSVMQLRPGTVVRDRIHTDIVRVIAERGPRLIRYAGGGWDTVSSAKRYLEIRTA